MTGIFYTDMVDVLEAAGCICNESSVNAGWQTRARSSGGWSAPPLAFFHHHTASNTTPANDLAYMCRNSPDAPIGNLYIDRDGVCWPIAAGASNCAGKGGPMTFSRGTIPLDGGNTRGWQCEVANDGVGQRWPQVQVDALLRASNVLNAHVGNQPYDITSHHAYAPSRKIDPATAAAVEGPWQPRSINSSGSWSLDDLITECVRRASTDLPPPTEPIPPEEDDMLRTVLVPTFAAGANFPYLALFDSGVVRPLASHEPEPLGGKHNLDSEAQYRQLCAWAKIDLP